MGGDAQPQVQAAVFSRHVLHRQRLDQALEGPRWYVGKTWGKPIGNLVVEARLDGNLIEGLMSAGHDVVLTDAIGHAGAVVLHPDGSMEGAHDPRADGGAAGV
jgi:gamma-glutamyltranspeptidase/glutathione hydrolase